MKHYFMSFYAINKCNYFHWKYELKTALLLIFLFFFRILIFFKLYYFLNFYAINKCRHFHWRYEFKTALLLIFLFFFRILIFLNCIISWIFMPLINVVIFIGNMNNNNNIIIITSFLFQIFIFFFLIWNQI